jgi:hypothetical protein
MFGSISRSSARFQDETLRHRRAAVDLLEQRRDARRDDVDEPELERLPSAIVRGVANHRLGLLRVPVVLPRELPDVGRRVVDDLLAQVRAEVLAGRCDRRRRADVRLRRHCEDVRGLADHGAGRIRARSRGRDVDDDRHVDREHLLHDRAHRGAEPARRVHLDHDGGVAVVGPPAHLVDQVVLRDGIHVVVELDDEHLGA